MEPNQDQNPEGQTINSVASCTASGFKVVWCELWWAWETLTLWLCLRQPNMSSLGLAPLITYDRCSMLLVFLTSLGLRCIFNFILTASCITLSGLPTRNLNPPHAAWLPVPSFEIWGDVSPQLLHPAQQQGLPPPLAVTGSIWTNDSIASECLGDWHGGRNPRETIS
jgi:hypothetical protein